MPGGGPDTACTARGRNKLIYTKKCTDACHTAAFLQSVAIRVGGTHAQLPESAASQSVPRPFSSLNLRLSDVRFHRRFDLAREINCAVTELDIKDVQRKAVPIGPLLLRLVDSHCDVFCQSYHV